MTTDLDHLLERAAADLDEGVRLVTVLDAAGVRRAHRRRTGALGIAAVLVVGAVSAAVVGVLRAPEAVAPADGLITSEAIMADGVVTAEEYRAAVTAVVACLEGAGIPAEADFGNGHASFSVAEVPERAEAEARCFERHLSNNVLLGWSVALGELDLAEARAADERTFACVEASTGLDFGELEYDRFGYPTPAGRAARDAAFEHEDHLRWQACRPPPARSSRSR